MDTFSMTGAVTYVVFLGSALVLAIVLYFGLRAAKVI